MLNLMKFKYWFFAVSLIIILPGLFFLARSGLRLSIDFTGGTLLEVQSDSFNSSEARARLSSDIEIASIQETSAGSFVFRTKPIDTAKKDQVMTKLRQAFGEVKELRFETVGPTIGRELTFKAVQAVVVASVAIILYIAYAFRQIPKPYSPWKFGLAAVVALLHDVLVVIGAFAILGHFAQVEVDALFITALLTVMGFSVHDTIVVFDRVRENLRKDIGRLTFEEVVNESLVQTLGRSLTTSLTVLFTLLALILFGGESIRYFVLALFIGILSGTYSSIFNAAPLLVIWEKKR